MGLDAVELLLRVEEEFGILIPDEEAERIAMAGQFCALIEGKLGLAPSSKREFCPTSRAFYRVRRELINLGVERQKIAPSTRFETLLPRAKRRAMWRALDEQFALPPLTRSPEFAFVGLLPLGVFPIWLLISPQSGAFAALIYLSLWAIGIPATRFLAVHAPNELSTVGALARRLVWQSTEPNSQSDVWPKLQLIIAEVCGVSPENVRFESDLVRDLGLG